MEYFKIQANKKIFDRKLYTNTKYYIKDNMFMFICQCQNLTGGFNIITDDAILDFIFTIETPINLT